MELKGIPTKIEHKWSNEIFGTDYYYIAKTKEWINYHYLDYKFKTKKELLDYIKHRGKCPHCGNVIQGFENREFRHEKLT